MKKKSVRVISILVVSIMILFLLAFSFSVFSVKEINPEKNNLFSSLLKPLSFLKDFFSFLTTAVYQHQYGWGCGYGKAYGETCYGNDCKDCLYCKDVDARVVRKASFGKLYLIFENTVPGEVYESTILIHNPTSQPQTITPSGMHVYLCDNQNSITIPPYSMGEFCIKIKAGESPAWITYTYQNPDGTQSSLTYNIQSKPKTKQTGTCQPDETQDGLSKEKGICFKGACYKKYSKPTDCFCPQSSQTCKDNVKNICGNPPDSNAICSQPPTITNTNVVSNQGFFEVRGGHYAQEFANALDYYYCKQYVEIYGIAPPASSQPIGIIQRPGFTVPRDPSIQNTLSLTQGEVTYNYEYFSSSPEYTVTTGATGTCKSILENLIPRIASETISFLNLHASEMPGISDGIAIMSEANNYEKCENYQKYINSLLNPPIYPHISAGPGGWEYGFGFVIIIEPPQPEIGAREGYVYSIAEFLFSRGTGDYCNRKKQLQDFLTKQQQCIKNPSVLNPQQIPRGEEPLEQACFAYALKQIYNIQSIQQFNVEYKDFILNQLGEYDNWGGIVAKGCNICTCKQTGYGTQPTP